MTRYSLPPEPASDVVWLTAPSGQQAPPEVWRKRREGSHPWVSERTGQAVQWRELLTRGDVDDVHPKVTERTGDHPLPWHVDSIGDVVDAEGEDVELRNVAELVRDAVAFYATNYRGDSPAQRAEVAGPSSWPERDGSEWVHPQDTPGRTIAELANATDDVLGNGHGQGGAPVVVRLAGQTAYATELRWDGPAGVFVIGAGENGGRR